MINKYFLTSFKGNTAQCKTASAVTEAIESIFVVPQLPSPFSTNFKIDRKDGTTNE